MATESKNLFSARNRTATLSFLALCIVLIVAGFDLMMPLGVAGGVPYVAMVMLGLWYPRRDHVLLLAVLGTFLTFLGYVFSPPGGETWVVLTNRLLAVFAIWVTAILIYNYASVMAERRKMARAVEQSSVGIVITDTEGMIEYVNPKVLEMTGYKEAEVLGQNPKIFKSEFTPAETYEDLWRTIKAGDEWHGEIVNKNKNGRLCWEEVMIFPIRDNTGVIINFVAIKEDITDRKRSEEELITAKQDAEAANDAKSSFLANMSHEFRTPLNAILGFSETMKMKVLGPLGSVKYEEYADNIHHSAAHLRQLVDEILDLSKVEAGKQDLVDKEIIIADLINTCLSLVKELAKKAEVKIDGVVDEGLPNLMADERMIRQVLLNLLSNAIKFTPAGGTVMVAGFLDENDRMTVQVSDNGIGISSEDFEKVHSVFGQVENILTRSHKGSGLGLPISRRLIELHGGEFKLESAVGEGTTAKMTFPESRLVEKTTKSRAI